jgi:hypothetical protein
MLRSYKICALISLNIAVFVSGCKNPPPPSELCIVGQAGLLCSDPRLKNGQMPTNCERCEPVEGVENAYLRPFDPESLNYIATNVSDYQRTQEWVIRRCGGRK